VTLTRARSVAAQLGITRVTEITRLDYAGVPVFASIRPEALPGSLCVNAGKGVRAAEARVGAYMEAIEYAFAEYGRSPLKVLKATARDLLDGAARPEAVLDFCPLMNAQIELDAPMACVEASDILTDERQLVPAELVFLPSPPGLRGKRYFGSSSNGLSSGNNVLEATVHGLAEVIERDICSFQSLDDHSMLLAKDGLPQPVDEIALNAARSGLALYVRYSENIFGLPYFMAAVAEVNERDPIFISAGYGCHPSKEIAVTRAVCEAFQSRLSYIHGGRDDLIARYERFEGCTGQERADYADTLLARVSRREAVIGFDEVEDRMPGAASLEAVLNVLVSSLAKNGLRSILRIVYTPEDYPLQVVRVIVPGLECFTETTARVGLRLRNHVRAQL
jgi:ribosomal protein S12 methylthiotransferase accessory factor